MIQALAIVCGLIGGFCLILSAIAYFTADNSDAKAMAILPLYLSAGPFILCGLLTALHFLVK